ncbi:hypothetical protein [Priestia megaterium]|uniref:hypothetical protein n=1 Tax=Priestia megaterium TaxID=1404 RepID=UPI001865FC05|nr:hypothetical protein [Priestia megaterium]MBE2975807.1 hypothetical protein [Priestia megaterium]
MGSGDVLNELIRNYIQKYNINGGEYESLRPKVQEQLVQIESYMQCFIQGQTELALKIKRSKLNLASVAAKSGLQRSTVYNNADTLKKYIEERINEVEHEDILSVQKKAKQKEDIEFLRSYLEKLELKLVLEEISEHKIKELELEFSKVNKINEDLQKQIHKLNQKNATLEQELRKLRKENIVKLDSSKQGKKRR